MTTGKFMRVYETSRGFVRIDFTDHGERACSLQESSLMADESHIWLGCSDGADARMQLSQSDVAALLPYLETFARSGELVERGSVLANPIESA